MIDHVHMLVMIPPKESISSFMGYLKGKSAMMMFDRHANLKYQYGNRHFWAEGYYVSTVGLNDQTVAKYIREQEAYDIAMDKLSVKEYKDPFEEKEIKKEKKKKDKKDEQIEDLTDRLRRQMAEFENFRKRTEKEKSQMFDMGAKTIVEKVLPVIDNFERGLAAVPEDKKEDAFVVGMDKIYKQFLTTLEEAGVKPIEAVGQEFDPNFHNAVMHVEDEELGENIVAEELQKGYMYRDAVVRHSMVKVAN